MLDHANFHGVGLLAVAQLDLEGLVYPFVAGVHLEIRLLAFAHEVEGISRRHAHRFIARRVVNGVLADELQLAVGIAAIETQLAGGQGYAELVRLGVLELALDDDLLVVAHAIAAVVVQAVELVAHRTVINVDGRRIHLFGVDELDLLGLTVMQRGRSGDAVEMKFVKGFLGDGGSGGGVHRHVA